VFEYLFQSLTCSALYVLCPVVHTHDEFTMGCQFEYNRVKERYRVAIALGFICQDDRNILREKFGEAILADIDCLFKFTWLGLADQPGTIAYNMKDLFNYDLRKDSGYKKKFFERVQPNIDTMWFDMGKEFVKGIVLIIVAYVMLKVGLKQ
jgi:hypothetical protein